MVQLSPSASGRLWGCRPRIRGSHLCTPCPPPATCTLREPSWRAVWARAAHPPPLLCPGGPSGAGGGGDGHAGFTRRAVQRTLVPCGWLGPAPPGDVPCRLRQMGPSVVPDVPPNFISLCLSCFHRRRTRCSSPLHCCHPTPGQPSASPPPPNPSRRAHERAGLARFLGAPAAASGRRRLRAPTTCQHPPPPPTHAAPALPGEHCSGCGPFVGLR